MAIISMRLPGSTLQCSDIHNGECHASPCRSPREALLFEQHLDLTSLHSKPMTPPSSLLPAPHFFPSSPLSQPPLGNLLSSASPSTPVLHLQLLSFPVPCPFYTQPPPPPPSSKESSHVLLLEKKVCVLVGLTQSLQGESEKQRGKSTRATGHLSLWVGRA